MKHLFTFTTLISAAATHPASLLSDFDSLAPPLSDFAPLASPLVKRASILPDCAPNTPILTTALSTCHSIATRAHAAALDPNHPLFTLFFKSSSQSTRSTVSSVLQAIARDSAGPAAATTQFTCVDFDDNCHSFYGYARAKNLPVPRVALCPRFFREAASEAQRGQSCGHLGAGSRVLHELSHTLGRTDDFNGTYGYHELQTLRPEENLRHADTYAFYAHAVFLGCSEQDLVQKRAPTRGLRIVAPKPPAKKGDAKPPAKKGDAKPPVKGHAKPLAIKTNAKPLDNTKAKSLKQKNPSSRPAPKTNAKSLAQKPKSSSLAKDSPPKSLPQNKSPKSLPQPSSKSLLATPSPKHPPPPIPSHLAALLPPTWLKQLIAYIKDHANRAK
ncbi:hypothetical protein CDD81_408 [Ophiocordyceps australis]|uniref:deuterolysin n=1 Tax=Ophiocordyceps australis TaxID=1399860 RepID=A0A2C5Y149_9HYPO|nr:hypothetical protein CDD81_408 [Ophiocordyceps australis]